MLKRDMLWVVLLGWAGVGYGQNLVPNWSFEEYSVCPFESNLLGGNVQAWYSIQSSPDYFHVCAEGTPQGYGVPLNIFDYQWPSHGDGYAGVLTYEFGVPHAREIIYTELLEPLPIGVPVYLSMKVAPAGQGDYPVPMGWVNKGIGLLLTTQPFQWQLETPFPNTAHLFANEILTDTLNWTTLSTSYVPDSAYQYATIANFFNDSLSTPVALDSNGLGYAYAFVDEVCVSLSPNGCDWSNGSAEGSVPYSHWWATTSFSEGLIVHMQSTPKEPVQLDLYDTAGRHCLTTTFQPAGNFFEWDANRLKNGLYILTARSPNAVYKSLRVLIVQR